MPVALAWLATAATSIFGVKLLADEAQETAEVANKTLLESAPTIVMLAAAGLGVFAGVQILRGKVKI